MFDNIVFLNPIFGIVILFLGLIGLYLYYKSKDFYIKFRFISDLKQVFAYSKSIHIFNMFFLLCLLLLFSVLVSNPNKVDDVQKITKDGIDIVLIFDLSLSMIADDMPPSRLEVAKQAMIDFVGEVESDRVGLINFSGKPFVGVPLTFDYDFLKNYIANITIETINQNYHHLQGTAIGDALLYGVNLFDEQSIDREKVMVLLTDGEVNRGIEPIEAIRYAREKGVKVHTVGIAGDEEAYITFRGQRLAVGGIDEESLTGLAALTGGEYYRVRDNTTFRQLFDNLNLLESREIEVSEYRVFEPHYKPFLMAIFLLFSVFLCFNIYYFVRD